MSLKHLFNVDAALSVLLHALKALVALFVNWIVLHYFAVDDFVIWSVTSSVLIVASACDLGIGQYSVTRLINDDRSNWYLHVGQSLGALIPLAAISALFVYIQINGPSRLYDAAMAAFLAGRILTIPFVAPLHAANQFKIRKAIELGAYILAALLVGGIALAGADIHLALVALNFTFLLGAVAMTLPSMRYTSIRQSLRATSLRQSPQVFRAAVPFMANNLTGLLTYGGFVWLSSLVLPQGEVAKLAVLHSFVLVNLYQIYDVFLKARQADLSDPTRVASYLKLNILIMLALPPAFLAVGREALALLSGSRVQIDAFEASLYGLFVAFELGNLFAQSVIQVNLPLVGRLKTYSAMRAAMLIAFLLVAVLSLPGEQAILALLGTLLVGSIVTFLYLIHGMKGGVLAVNPMKIELRPSQHPDR